MAKKCLMPVITKSNVPLVRNMLIATISRTKYGMILIAVSNPLFVPNKCIENIYAFVKSAQDDQQKNKQYQSIAQNT